MDVPILSADEVRRLVRDGEIGVAMDRPVVAVEDDDALMGWSPGAAPVVLVAVRPAGWDAAPARDDPCDVVIAADDPRVESLLVAIDRHPQAATATAVLLRSTPWVDVEAGLAAESAVYSMLQAGPEFGAWRSRRPTKPMPDDEQPVVVDRHDERLTITLNRPTSHNAVNEALRNALVDALTLAVVDTSVEVVVLRGNGPSYCSGGDLRTFGEFPDVVTAHASRLTRSPGRLAHALRDRLRVELHGACLGAGIEVPAFAGYVSARADAMIGLPEIGIGLLPGAGGTVSLPRRIGRHRAALLALSAAPIDAAAAAAWGLVDDVFAAGDR